MKCNFPVCCEPVKFVCMCGRCNQEPNEGKFWSCAKHADSQELITAHQRVFGRLRFVTFGGSPSAAIGDELSRVAQLISAECDAVKAMLLQKNAAYGNSAIQPLRIASKASSVEQLLVRIDDKLSRLARGSAAGEDVWLDLLGYIVLLRVAQKLETTEK